MDSEDLYSEDLDPFAGKKAGGGDRKRRFSDDQIKSLETMFETQSKLEPRVKIQLARELELQPRQVAIWFQNKRARWKSKQLERQYFALKTEYDALKCSFDALDKEKQLLIKQSQKLEELLEREGGDVSFAEEGLKLGEEEEKVVCVGHQEEAELLYWGEPAGGGGVERRRCFESEGSPGKSYEWWDFWPLNDHE